MSTLKEKALQRLARESLSRIHLRRMAIELLKPADYNPRMITDEAKAGLRKSVETFGYVEPIVWNERSGNIVGGHQRLTTLLSLGEEYVDVSVVDLDDTDERALNITLNNPTIQGEFDNARLATMLDELTEDLPELTFDDLNLAGLLEVLTEQNGTTRNQTPPDKFEEVDSEGMQIDYCCPKCSYEWSGKSK